MRLRLQDVSINKFFDDPMLLELVSLRLARLYLRRRADGLWFLQGVGAADRLGRMPNSVWHETRA